MALVRGAGLTVWGLVSLMSSSFPLVAASTEKCVQTAGVDDEVCHLQTLSKKENSKLKCEALVKSMGRGINLGNIYDLPGLRDGTPEAVAKNVDWAVEKGFKHIRLPVTWGSKFDKDSAVTRNATAIVDYALGKGLKVLLNTHHEFWLKDAYDGSACFDDLFSDLWQGIADHFHDRDNDLMFEILNEPEGTMGTWYPPKFPLPSDEGGQKLTRQINNVGYKAVRAISKDRMIFVSPNGMANQGQASAVYPSASYLPGGGEDSCVGVTVHSYDPWDFCGQDSSNCFFDEENHTSCDNIGSMMGSLKLIYEDVFSWAQKTGFLVHLGEFGIGQSNGQDRRDTDMARTYYRFVANLWDSWGIPVTAWDDGGWFGIYGSSFGLADALLDPVPPMAPFRSRDATEKILAKASKPRSPRYLMLNKSALSACKAALD